MKKRIGLIGLYHESNTFAPERTTLAHFQKGRYMKGDDILKEYREAHHEMGGMIEVLEKEDVEIVPILYAEATPGGTITSDTYDSLWQDLMASVEKALPLDGLMVAPHGAGVSESYRDMDGHWLSGIREMLGKQIPIVGTLDLHANVSPLMVSSTDALVSYRQNPHVDQRARGKESANLMVRHLRGDIKLTQALVQAPLAISIEQQLTADEPCRSLYQYAHELSEQEGIVSLSIQLGFPYADVQEMGTSIIVVSDNDPALALTTGEKLRDYIIAHKQDFVGEKTSVSASLAQAENSPKPVLLLDMGDNIGGGSPGNSICILEELERQKKLTYFLCLYDPAAVQEAEKCQQGDSYTLDITGSCGEENRHYHVEVKLVSMSDGAFQEKEPRHGGQVNYKMGRTAIVVTKAGSIIMLTSLRTPPFSLQQLLAFDIQPAQFDVIIAKGVNAPIAAYAPVCPTIIQVDTPGVTQADMTRFTFHNRRRPLYPFEQI